MRRVISWRLEKYVDVVVERSEGGGFVIEGGGD
jgi:hypothetical protein